MKSNYRIQSDKQAWLLDKLATYPSLLLRPNTPPIKFELMGQLSIRQTPEADKLQISAQGIQQMLSIEWSEVRLADLDPQQRQLQLSDGQQNLLWIQNPEGDLAELKPFLGLLQDLPRLPEKQTVLELDNGWQLSDIEVKDRYAYLHYLNDPLIYQHTLNIPYPYTERDADQWLAMLDYKLCRLQKPLNLALRNPQGELCGGIGLQLSAATTTLPHKSELGYWLAQPYWSKGIMTLAVKAFTQWAFQEFGLQRLTAQIFTDNLASEKVLLKAGFELEGLMTKYYLKEQRLHDGKLYALTPGQMAKSTA